MRALALGDDAALGDWIANESAERLSDARRDARAAHATLEALGARVVALGDAEYPPGLRDLRDPPAFLCVRGTLPPRGFRTGTAVIGSRDADAEARAFACALAGAVASPIVSGLARGVDAAAHEGALRAEVPTIAYLGNGFGVTYPPEHAELERRIVAAGGALLTEFLPFESVTRWSLVRRDRLQPAHVTAVALVCSEPDGGAMHAMAAAKKLGRVRFACIPRAGRNDDGNIVAIAEGAMPLPWNVPEAAALLAEHGGTWPNSSSPST